MTDPAVTAKQLVDLARKHLEDQQSRIVRQRELVAMYERNDKAARLLTARRVLQQMQKQLAQMTAAHVAAEEHLSKLTVDEASVEKVVRDTPMQREQQPKSPHMLRHACGYALANKGHDTRALQAYLGRRNCSLHRGVTDAVHFWRE